MKLVALAALILVAVACGSQDLPLPPTSAGAPSEASSPSSTPSSDPSPEPEPVSVRNVVGKGIGKAETLLDRAGLAVLTSTKFSRLPAGTVLRQRPGPGSQVDEGSVIELVVAMAFPRIPPVLGKSLGRARSILTAAGYEIRVVRQISSRPKNTVIDQSPAGGFEALPGRVVTLTLAKPAPAPPPTNCTPGYSPCLPPASDYDCAGGSGNGPEYVYGTVSVTGSDPYGLDADNDGYGCE